ncbi:MAG: hypothetical protein ACC645_14090, partial [Pirellulales bacterium]
KENGSENCHGPSAGHVAAEEGDIEVDDDRLEQLRAQLRIELEEGEAEGHPAGGKVGKVTASCYACHDPDNSPDFSFKTYWPEVEHHGTD